MSKTGGWVAGERVELVQCRRGSVNRMVCIDRVTPAGFACVGYQKFRDDGQERGGDRWRASDIRRVSGEDAERINNAAALHGLRLNVRDALRTASHVSLSTDQCYAILTALEDETE